MLTYDCKLGVLVEIEVKINLKCKKHKLFIGKVMIPKLKWTYFKQSNLKTGS